MPPDRIIGELVDLQRRSAARGAPRRGAERGVMVYHDHPVGRQMHVEFDPVGSIFEGSLESRKGVLGPLARGAAMRDDLDVASSVRWYGVGSHRAKVDQPLDT